MRRPWIKRFPIIIIRRRLIVPARLAIAHDNQGNTGDQVGTDTFTGDFTVTGASPLLMCGLAMSTITETVSSITYNGAALTNVGARNSVSGALREEIWGLVAPATGTHSLVVTLTGSINWVGMWDSFTGCHQTTAWEAYNDNTGLNGLSAVDATVVVTTLTDNSWVYSVLCTNDPSVTALQTERNNVSATLGSGGTSDTGPITPAGAQTMGWTGVGPVRAWVIGGVALIPAAAAGRTTKNTRSNPLGVRSGVSWRIAG